MRLYWDAGLNWVPLFVRIRWPNKTVYYAGKLVLEIHRA